MSKLSVAIIITLMMLFTTVVHADHWRQDASLIPGTYMVVYEHESATAQTFAMQEFAAEHGIESTILFQAVMEAIVITINKEYTTEKLVKFLNTDPLTVGPILFTKDKVGWRQIPMPCKLVVGDVTM